tara:strand:+ start:631 stop:813 length:183 start_codon:yes stop_codon:yes gene_type:complete
MVDIPFDRDLTVTHKCYYCDTPLEAGETYYIGDMCVACYDLSQYGWGAFIKQIRDKFFTK